MHSHQSLPTLLSNFMILYFSQKFKHISHLSESALQELYDKQVNKHIESFVCPNPKCSHEHTLSIVSSYPRYLYTESNVCMILNIHVVKCEECGTYHAILPFFLLPFSSYSYSFIIKILYLYFFGSIHGNKMKVCAAMNISRSVLNHMILMFSKEEVISANKEINMMKLKESLDRIMSKRQDLYDFLLSFIDCHNHILFLFTTIMIRAFHVAVFKPPNKSEK